MVQVECIYSSPYEVSEEKVASYEDLHVLLVGECWASGSDPADASADVSMPTAHAGERTTQR